VALWDSEIEAARDRIRFETSELLALYGDIMMTLFPGGPGTAPDPSVLGTLRSLFTIPQAAGATERFTGGPAGPIRLRVFAPPDPAGVLLHLHGGGWCMGAPEQNDRANAMLSERLGIAVVSPDYRLLPEHPYPAMNDDCEAVAVWLATEARREFGTARLAIKGESAGAHLAVGTLLRLRDAHDGLHRRFGAAVLEFGLYDCTRTPSQLDPRLGGQALNSHIAGCLIAAYQPGAGPARLRAPEVSPLYADLTGMPPALFSCGTRDLLIDDTLFMASRWELAGAPVTRLIYPDAPHGCTELPAIEPHWTPRLTDFLSDRLGLRSGTAGQPGFAAAG
jgi:acetyl esterase/lipase